MLADIGVGGAIEFMLVDIDGCCDVMPVEMREELGPVSEPEVGRVPARGSETSRPAASRTLFNAMARRSMAPTTLRPSGRAAEATPTSVFFDPTTSVRSDVLENVACQLATALSLSPSSRYMSGATPASGFQSL